MINVISLLRLNIDIAIFIVIMIVQLIIYPAFKSIDANIFSSWHHDYMGKISILIGPLMIAQALLITYQCFQNNHIYSYLSLLMMMVVWITTFIYSVPCHNKLQNIGYDIETINLLINTNWIRTIAWTICLILAIIIYKKTI